MPDDEHRPEDDVLDHDDELDESTVHHVDAIDLRSLGLVSGLFYLTAFLVLALAIACVWLLAAGLGLISQLEDFMRSIGFRGFRLVGPEVVVGFVLVLGALVVFLTVMTLVAGAFYNLLGTSRRGVRVRLSPVHPEVDEEPADEKVTSAPTVIEPVASRPEPAMSKAGHGAEGAGAKGDGAKGDGARRARGAKAAPADEADESKPAAAAG